MTGEQASARQIKESVGKDVLASRGAEDRVNRGLGILAAQLPGEVEADEQASDKVVTRRGQTRAAAFQLPDALQQATVKHLMNAARDLSSKGPFKAAPEMLAPLGVQEKGKAFWRGSRFQRFGEG